MVAKSERDEETLRAFLEHFGLLVPVPSTGLSGARSWLVPSLLPKRNHPAAGPAEALGKASLFFDFHGALRQLLPSLLPRLFAELQKSEDLSSQVKMVCQDYLAFSMKSAGQPIFVTLELVSEPREMLQLTVTDAQHPEVGHLIMSETFQVISLGFNTCVPKLSFTAKVPCPLCCHADSSGAPKHLLDIDVLSELQLFCSHSQKVFSERSLPAYLQAWRAEQLREPVAPLPAGVESLPELGNEPGVFQLNFLYASPLLCGSQPLQALDIMSEVQALQGVAGISPDVDVATFANLQERLLRPLKGPTVLHLSAHVATAACALTATHVTKPQLLLEDPRGLAHPLSEEALASMASWKAAEYQPSTASWLLVFLACGSERLVQHLMRTAGLREAICCRGQVFDSAARVFCKAFYQALAARCDVAESHQVAQAAVRNSASLGLQGEADKFLYLRSGAEPLPRPAAEGLGNVAKWPSWRPWPRVEDYAVCRLLDSCRIAAAFQSDASHRRRVVQILGDMGMGKSAMCREFCGYFSSPGRMFANRAFLVDEASFKSFQANGNDEELVATAILQTLEQPGSESVVQLPAFAKTMDLAGPWLLAIDGLSEMPHLCPAIVKILDSLLSQTSSLKLLLTSRKRVSLRPSGTGYSGFAASKAVELSLQPLPPQSAAELFRQRAHREFCTADFDALAKAVPAEALQILQHGPTLLERLAASPLLHALGGIPGRIVEAADRVDSSLASLLQHPMVPSEWTQHSGGDLPALEPSP